MLPTIKRALKSKEASKKVEKNTFVEPNSDLTLSDNQPAKARKLTLKKVLYHPLTWVALGFHLLLLFVPFSDRASNEEVLEDLENGPEEAIAIDLLNLSEIATSTPPPAEPPPTEPPPAAPPAPSAPPPAPSQAAIPPEPVDNPTEVPSEAPTVEEPATEAPVEQPVDEAPVEVPPDPPLPAYDPGEDQSVFIKNLGAVGLNDYTDQGLPPTNFFRDPDNAGYFLNGDQPVQGAASARWVDKGPSDVLNQLQTSYAPTGIVFTQLQNYGGEELYELTTPTGQTFMHISLVRLKGSTLLVIWQDRPA